MIAGVSGQGVDGEWASHSKDVKNTRYAALDQVNAGNFSKLEVAWRFKTDNLGPRPEYKLEGTPLMVNGVVYATAGTRRAVVALDAGTGELLWTHSEHEGARGSGAPRVLSGRGLAYWSDGKTAYVLYVTPGYRLIALDAKTGALVATFGKNGVVDLKEGLVYGTGQQIDLTTGEVGLHSTPVVAKDVVIVGAARGRRRTRTCLPAGRVAHRGLLRRTSAGEQSIWRKPGMRRSADGKTQVAFPVGAPSNLGLRHLGGTDLGRHQCQWPVDQGRRATNKAGFSIRLRSGYR
jgi:hypothetical protein